MDDAVYRAAVRAFVAERITPHVEDWERAGSYPAELHREAGAQGLLAFGEPPGSKLPEQPTRMRILVEEITRGGSQGLTMGLASHAVSLAILAAAGADWSGAVTQDVLVGRRTIALALTEPQAGSDLSALTMRAHPLDRDVWSLDGEKRFICNGARADCLIVGAMTETGFSLFLAERPDSGLSAEAIEPSGWRCLPLAGLHFEGVRARLICEPGRAGRVLQRALMQERLNLATMAIASAEAVRDEAGLYAARRMVRGAALQTMSHVRQTLADVATDVAIAGNFVRTTTVVDGASRVAMAKNAAAGALNRAASAAVRLHGAAGCINSSLVARTLRDAPLVAIGGGTTEVMNEIIARSLSKEISHMAAATTQISDHAAQHSRALLDHAFQRHCGLELIEQEPGRCRCRLVVGPAVDNLSQALHGGVTYAMLDVTSMLATLPLLEPDEYAVSTNMAVSILTAVPRDTVVEFESEVMRAGRSMIFTSTRAVKIGPDGSRKLVATAQVSKARLRQDIRQLAVPQAA